MCTVLMIFESTIQCESMVFVCKIKYMKENKQIKISLGTINLLSLDIENKNTKNSVKRT